MCTRNALIGLVCCALFAPVQILAAPSPPDSSSLSASDQSRAQRILPVSKSRRLMRALERAGAFVDHGMAGRTMVDTVVTCLQEQRSRPQCSVRTQNDSGQPEDKWARRSLSRTIHRILRAAGVPTIQLEGMGGRGPLEMGPVSIECRSEGRGTQECMLTFSLNP